MLWLYERERVRNVWIFCARAHESEKKLLSRSPRDERALGAPLKWAALTKALHIVLLIYSIIEKRVFGVFLLWNRCFFGM